MREALGFSGASKHLVKLVDLMQNNYYHDVKENSSIKHNPVFNAHTKNHQKKQ